MGRKRPVDPETQYFRYLNRLRAAGRTNMYGAVPYLMRAFGLERAVAFEVICRWVDAFDIQRAAAPSEGRAELSGPLPPRAPKRAAVVVHRPRRPSRAKPPKNRKPLPDVGIKVKSSSRAKSTLAKSAPAKSGPAKAAPAKSAPAKSAPAKRARKR